VPFVEIWRALEVQWHAPLSPELRARYTPQPDAVLVRCPGCDLEYFSPLNGGDADFYDELMTHIRYESDRWEFGIVKERVVARDTVVDYGCGSGAFLRRVCPGVARAVGVDHNREAVEALRRSGIEAYRGTPGEFARDEEARFTVACAFQMLEHVPAADNLLVPLLDRLAPDGRIFLSVPNRERVGRGDLEPLDCPPHHVSRWSLAAMEQLAKRYGLEVATVDFESPTYSNVAWALSRRVQRYTRFLPGATPEFAARAIRRGLVGPRRHAMLARRGWFMRHGLAGHTMLAELRPAS
jgi:SAM-dependent methyltransferase